MIITKNQDWNIDRLIKSVLKETAYILEREITLVDSASSDRTVAIAAKYPIKVLRLRPDQRLTASAGRNVGYKHSSGDLVLFLDGDMELYPGWLAEALVVIRDRAEVAVVAGPWIDLPKLDKRDDMAKFRQIKREYTDEEISYVGGAALYRRSVLEQVGPFNPWLYSDEEPELCMRIRHAGFRIVRLGHSIAYHYSDPPDYMSTLVARWRRGLYLGSGQVLRYHLGDKLFWTYLYERGFGVAALMVAIVGLAGLLASLVTGQILWFGLWLTLFVLFVVFSAVRKRSFRRTIVSLLHRALIVDGTIRGFRLKPLEPDSFMAKLDVIKVATPPSGSKRHIISSTL